MVLTHQNLALDKQGPMEEGLDLQNKEKMHHVLGLLAAMESHFSDI